MQKSASVVVAAVVLALASSARAANVLSIENVTAAAGDTLIEIPIDLAVSQGLTRLHFDVAFDPAFCNALDDPTDLDITSDGRNLTDPEDDDYVCSDGVLGVDLIDDTGAVDPGMGLILVIEIGDLKPNASGRFKFTPRNIRARAGNQNVTITGTAGFLTVTGSSSPPPPPPETGCPSSLTFEALGCRLDALIAQVETEVESGTLPRPMLRRLVRAKRALAKGEILCIGRRTRRTRAVVQRVARTLLAFRRSLEARRPNDDVRETLTTAAEGIAADARAFREGLECPISSPAGAFLDPLGR